MAAPYRDRDFLKAAAAALRDTDQFSAVTTWGPPEAQGESAEHLTLAGLEIQSFTETEFGNEPGAELSYQRDVTYLLHVYVRNPDPDARDDEADRLVQVALNVLTDASLLSETVVDLTGVRSGRWLPATGVERRVQVTGTVTYLIDTSAGRTGAD